MMIYAINYSFRRRENSQPNAESLQENDRNSLHYSGGEKITHRIKLNRNRKKIMER